MLPFFRFDLTATTMASIARSAADLDISAAWAICSIISALFIALPLLRSSMRYDARLGVPGLGFLYFWQRRHIDIGKRRRLAFQRNFEHLVDPLHRHDLELVLDVVGDLL